MDDLDRFQQFRRGVAAPRDDARERAAARLTRVLQAPTKRRLRRYGAVAMAAFAAASAAALFITAPWGGSPSFLERAQAALAANADTILHAQWEATTTSTDPACTVERGPTEIWVDQAPPHRYRMLASDHPLSDPRTLACTAGRDAELGGTLEPLHTLIFDPPNTLRESPLAVLLPADPVAELREALDAGRAHDEGETQLDGRSVRRIRVDGDSGCAHVDCPNSPTYVYVDPDSFYPVEIRGPGVIVHDGPAVHLQVVLRYRTFEYLPRTVANLALADIRAQHPHATGP